MIDFFLEQASQGSIVEALKAENCLICLGILPTCIFTHLHIKNTFRLKCDPTLGCLNLFILNAFFTRMLVTEHRSIKCKGM